MPGDDLTQQLAERLHLDARAQALARMGVSDGQPVPWSEVDDSNRAIFTQQARAIAAEVGYRTASAVCKLRQRHPKEDQ